MTFSNIRQEIEPGVFAQVPDGYVSIYALIGQTFAEVKDGEMVDTWNVRPQSLLGCNRYIDEEVMIELYNEGGRWVPTSSL